jgi:hypothetical protein
MLGLLLGDFTMGSIWSLITLASRCPLIGFIPTEQSKFTIAPLL